MENASGEADIIRPVREQLAAYDAKDIDRFMQWWADDCQYYAFPSELLGDGAKQIRERHVERFKEPNLHGRLVQRMVVGNLVADREVVTRNFPDGLGEVDVLAIYEVKAGRTVCARFKFGERKMGCQDNAR